MEIFKRDDGFTRYDFQWYGFGKMPDHGDVVRQFKETSPGRRGTHHPHGWEFFINTYNGAPIRIKAFQRIGWYLDAPTTWFGAKFTGSMVKPDTYWFLRIGRLFFGGYTPKFVRKINSIRHFISNSRYGYDMEVYMARRNEPDFEMPKQSWRRMFATECWQRLVCWQKGHIIDQIDSSIGPDHGWEDFGCSRCGWSAHVCWY